MAERAANGQPEIDSSGKEDIFEMQHHHLLRCLEKTTDREFVEVELPFNGGPKRLGSTSAAPSPSPSEGITSTLFANCCGSNCCKKKSKTVTQTSLTGSITSTPTPVCRKGGGGQNKKDGGVGDGDHTLALQSGHKPTTLQLRQNNTETSVSIVPPSTADPPLMNDVGHTNRHTNNRSSSDQQPTLNAPVPPGGPGGGGGKQLHTTAAVVLNEDTTTPAVKSTASSTGVELSPAQAAEAMLTATTTTITPAVNGSSGGAADAAGEVKISNL